MTQDHVRGDGIKRVVALLVTFCCFSGSPARAGSISGSVTRHSDGRPLEAAWLTLYQGIDPFIADEDAWNAVGSTATDSNGDYEFTELPERRYRIRASSQEIDGQSYFEANVYNIQVFEDAKTPNMDLELQECGMIYGKVTTADGTPLFAQVVRGGTWLTSGSPWQAVSTDAEGNYRLCVAPSPGKFYHVGVSGASLQGIVYESEWDPEFYRATIEGTRVDFVLEPGGTARGRVVNEEGVGIAGVWAFGEWNRHGTANGPWASTDEDGRFSLRGLPAGPNEISLSNDWLEIEQDGVKYMLGEVRIGPFDVAVGETVDVGEFVIYRAGKVTGMVTDEAGFPVVAAEVKLEGFDIAGHEAERDEVITDAFGQFTIDYVAPGTHWLHLEKDGFLEGRVTDIVVRRGEQIDLDVVLRREELATVSGRIANYFDIAEYDTSNDVAYPYYEDSDYDEFGLGWFEVIALDLDEAFTQEDYVDPGKKLVAEKGDEEIDDGYGNYFETDANETPGHYDMTLPSGQMAMGLIVGQEAHPGREWVVFHDWRTFHLTKGDVRRGVDFTAVTEDTGALRGDLSVPAGYVFPQNWCWVYAYSLDANDNVTTAIPVGNAIAITTRGTSYEIQGLPEGRYRLKAHAKNLATTIVPSVVVSADQTTVQDIAFTPGGTLKGRVTDGTNAIAAARVTLGRSGKRARTDDTGSYEITGVDTGTYRMDVVAEGYAAATATVSLSDGVTTDRDLELTSNVGSIAGTVITSAGIPVNGVTVLAYNESNDTFRTAGTVAGEFSIADLSPGQYILAVDAIDQGYGVVTYPADGSGISLAGLQDLADVNILIDVPRPPELSVVSTFDTDDAGVLAIEFHATTDLLAEPSVAVIEGNGTLGNLTSNAALNRFQIDYATSADDTIVRIEIAETVPYLAGSPARETFSFDVSSNLIQTASTNVTNAIGGDTSLAGTQDNTKIYVPPFAIAGVDEKTAVTLVIERYGDPGDPVGGLDDATVSSVYDFSFEEDGVSVAEEHSVTVTMSFQLPKGMTREDFEDTLSIRYFEVDEGQWKTDGIDNVRINWLNSTILFDVNHLTPFAAFVGSPIGTEFLRADCNADGTVDIADPIASLGFQFAGTFDPPCRDALDFDDNGIVDISDPIANLTHQFLGGSPPAPPGKDACGVDPTEDGLGCKRFRSCP